MTHIQPELMQRFLANEADLMEREAIADHLALCDECAARLAVVAAEDDGLTLALKLEPGEAEWIASLDLAPAVLKRVNPWYGRPSAYLPFLLAGAPAALSFYLITYAVKQMLLGVEPVGAVVMGLQTLLPALYRLILYLARGGMLTTIWPALLLAAAIWFWSARRKKEVSSNA